MVEVLPGNGLQSSLVADLTAGGTALQISAADAPNWPATGEYRAVLSSGPTGPFELVRVTGGQGTDTLTITRAVEKYNGDQTAKPWVSGTRIAAVITKDSLSLTAPLHDPTLSGPTIGLGATKASSDVFLQREGANLLAVRSGTNAQILRIYNKYTDGSNYEFGMAGWGWPGADNEFTVGTRSDGTGSIRPSRFYAQGDATLQSQYGVVNLTTQSINRLTVANDGVVTITNKLNVGNAASAYEAGDIAASRNSAPATGVIYLGSGGTKYLFYNGTDFSLQGGGLQIGSGIVNVGGGLQVTGSGQPSSGAGMEIFNAGALSHLHGYNRSAGTYQSVQLTGLVITLQSMSGGYIVYGSGGGSYNPSWPHNFNGNVITSGRFYQQANGGAYCWDAADFGVSVGAAGNTVVKRDGNGYIMGSYINLSADVQGGAPVYVAGQNGDNYLRWYPKA